MGDTGRGTLLIIILFGRALDSRVAESPAEIRRGDRWHGTRFAKI